MQKQRQRQRQRPTRWWDPLSPAHSKAVQVRPILAQYMDDVRKAELGGGGEQRRCHIACNFVVCDGAQAGLQAAFGAGRQGGVRGVAGVRRNAVVPMPRRRPGAQCVLRRLVDAAGSRWQRRAWWVQGAIQVGQHDKWLEWKAPLAGPGAVQDLSRGTAAGQDGQASQSDRHTDRAAG